MEQNTQPVENNAEIKLNNEDESNNSKPNKKIILLITIILIIVGSGAVYFLFLNKEDNSSLPVKDKKEVEIDRELDTDQDGLPDYMEKIIGTDENNLDTDGDSYDDFEEIKNGYDPLTDKKYTEEEREIVKEKIKNEDNEFFKEMFGESDKTVDNCSAFPNKLDLCESFSCKFEHLFTGEIMEKRIIGLVNNKCQYTEEMPNNGKMDCEYSESLRKAIAQYHRDLAVAESIGTSVSGDLGSGDIKMIYTIDGKEVENPLQEAMDSGECIVSGYNNAKTNNGLEVDIEFPKNAYEFDETLDGKYYLKYEGESFKGILSASLLKEGFTEKSFSGMTKTTIKAQPRAMVSKMIFFDEKAVECKGKYTYTLSVYDCASIDNTLDTQDCGGSWDNKLQETIENKVKPMATSSETISVICKDGKEDCKPVNYVWTCNKFVEKCKEGFHCLDYNCIKD